MVNDSDPKDNYNSLYNQIYNFLYKYHNEYKSNLSVNNILQLENEFKEDFNLIAKKVF